MLDFYSTLKNIYIFFANPCGSGSTVVGTQSRLPVGWFGVRIPTGVKDFSVLYNLLTAFRAHLVPNQWVKKFLLRSTTARL